MAQEAEKKRRPNQKQENWTQFDRELIVAARDGKKIHACISVETLVDTELDLEANVEVVDKYMLKLKNVKYHTDHGDVAMEDPIWIQKHLLVGVVIEP